MVANRPWMLVLSAAAVLAAAAPAGAEIFPGENRLTNSGAEAALAGWAGTGFVPTPYGTGGVTRSISGRADDPTKGAQFFAASEHGAVISQIVDFSDRATAIDSGSQPLSWGADGLGGRAGEASGARLVIQSLDSAGAALGPPLVVGPPSDRDRQHKTSMLSCYAGTTAPIGMRSVLVSLQAVGHGIADDLFLLDQPIYSALSASLGPFRAPDAVGCMTGEPVAPQAPRPGLTPPAPARVPTLDALVSMPAARRCGRPGPLRFRVTPGWRNKVSRLIVRARGVSSVGSASGVIEVQPPHDTLHVSIRVMLRDGRERTGTRRYAARCTDGKLQS